MEIKYVGCFFDKRLIEELANEINANRLYRVIENPHVTLLYKPVLTYQHLYGEKLFVKIIGYANNGRNEAFLVSMESDNEEIMKLLKDKENYHITISISADSKAVESNYLKFEKCNKKELVGFFGCMDMDEKTHII